MRTCIAKSTRGAGFAALGLLGLLGSACTYDSADLRDYVAEVKSRPGGQIQEIDGFRIPETIPEVSQRVDPFASFLADELANVGDPVDPEQAPWPPHNPEELERFALDSLRMVGTLDQQDEQWGLVKGPDGVIHRVKVGNFMGKNYGKIVELSEQRIHLLEKVSDGRGQWQEREAEISLSEIKR